MDTAERPLQIGSPYSPPDAVPVVIVDDRSFSQESDGEIASSRLFDYLQSAQGHEIAKGVLEIVQDIKKAALVHSTGQARLERYLQLGIVISVVLAASALAALGKLDSTISVLFGTLVGYVFGKKS